VDLMIDGLVTTSRDCRRGCVVRHKKDAYTYKFDIFVI
jgi:hypothetical protein